MTSVGISSPGSADDPLALELCLRVTPQSSPVGATVTIELVLRNRSPAVVTVNARLLMTPSGNLGEVTLDADGPVGYLNEAGFRVRAGSPSAEDFADLRPGGEIRRSWPLDRYQSLHLPGRYRLTAIYHNAIDVAPDGRPVAVDEYRATAVIVRTVVPEEEP